MMFRKLALTTAVAMAVIGGTVSGAGPAAATHLPVVNMAAVDAASQAEGLYGNKAGLGDTSTKLVQRALTAKGFPVTADGWYNRTTTAAYAAYQRSLGYSGINANGIPGPSSLAKLGTGRFTLSHKVYIGSRTDLYGTKRVNTRTKRMLAAADSRVPWTITVSQGSYCAFEATCVAASGGTHDGGGAIDVSVAKLTTTARWETVKALRTVGFAAWLRTPDQCGGCWPYHIHAIAIGDTDMWQRDGKFTNRDQVADYFVGKNGLAGHAYDNTPSLYRVPFTWWERYAGL
ncbi:MAG: peptidoglycan-binding protein [Propionibacteriaceae bacterium]|nr:peptidoglycan-binding protein [Propionibacteriaceae bacterium]